MTRTERSAWSDLLMTHTLTDVYSTNEFTKATSKHFTWQGKRGGVPIFSRIDRFYASQGIRVLEGNTGAWPTLMGISDHAAVHCQINKVMKRSRSRASFHMPLLHSPKGRAKLKEAWNRGLRTNPTETWSKRVDDAIKSTMRCSDI